MFAFLFVFLFVTLTVCVFLGYRRAHCEGYIVAIYRSILIQFSAFFRRRNALSNVSKISELHQKIAPHLCSGRNVVVHHCKSFLTGSAVGSGESDKFKNAFFIKF